MDRTGYKLDETRQISSQFDVVCRYGGGDLPDDRYHFICAAERGTSLQIDGRSFDLVDRQIAAISPGERTCVVGEAAAVVSFRHEFFCIRVSRSEVFCDGIVFNRISAGPVITMPSDEWLSVLFRIGELERIHRSASPLREERLISTLRTLLLACADARLWALDLPARQSGPSPEILAFQDALETLYLTHPNADALAEACDMSPAKLNKVVKAELGMTVVQAASERLAIEARMRLRSGKSNVKQVAYDLGFSDQFYFSRFFKRHFGASPVQFFQLRS